MHHSLKGYVKTYYNPVLLAYGTSRRVCPFVIIPAILCNDNEEAWKLLNLRMMNNERPCRLCNVSKADLNTRQVMFEDGFRNANYLHQLGIRSEEAYFKSLTKPKGSRNWTSAEENRIIEECRLNGMYPGKNPLHEIFEWIMEHKLGDLFSASIFDTLHTWYKGPVEQCVRYGTTCIFLLCEKVLYCYKPVINRL
jgi:hypothetical protein